MLWRLLWSLRARPPGGGAGAAAPGLCRRPPVAPVRAHDRPPPLPSTQSAQAGSSHHGRHQQHKGFRCGNLLQRCAPLDAVTWGALAVLALELAKQIQWLNSVQLRGDRSGLHHLKGHLAVLPPRRHTVPSTAPPACSSGEKEPHSFVGGNSGQAPEITHPSKTSQPEESQLLSETEEDVFQRSTSPEPASCLLRLQANNKAAFQEIAPSAQVLLEDVILKADNLELDESLWEAASQVQQAFQASVSVAFNVLGLELMQDRQQKLAFSCFRLAADQHYSKAQFNVGLCYELGRGTKKNVAKAALYYQQAAHQGHPVAQYRYAKWLLRHWPNPTSDSSVQEAVSLLDQAATAGLTQRSLDANRLCTRNRIQEKTVHSSSTDFTLDGKVLISLTIDYCNVLYMGLPLKTTRKLQLVQNAAALVAQAYLGVLYLKGLEPGKENVQKYLRMAANSGDPLSRFHLGVCYEKGFGVPQNQLSARKHYRQAAEEGCKPAQERMKMRTEEGIAAMQSRHQLPLASRTCSSSPCLQSLDQPPPPPRLEQPALSLLHSWSTGDLSDVTNSCVNCSPIPAFPDGLSFKLQPFALTSRIAVG